MLFLLKNRKLCILLYDGFKFQFFDSNSSILCTWPKRECCRTMMTWMMSGRLVRRAISTLVIRSYLQRPRIRRWQLRWNDDSASVCLKEGWQMSVRLSDDWRLDNSSRRLRCLQQLLEHLDLTTKESWDTVVNRHTWRALRAYDARQLHIRSEWVSSN